MIHAFAIWLVCVGCKMKSRSVSEKVCEPSCTETDEVFHTFDDGQYIVVEPCLPCEKEIEIEQESKKDTEQVEYNGNLSSLSEFELTEHRLAVGCLLHDDDHDDHDDNTVTRCPDGSNTAGGSSYLEFCTECNEKLPRC